MSVEPNQKVMGAFVIGFALVAGAWTIANFGSPRLEQPATVAVSTTPRVAIDVTDNDENGIEDWRDQFVTTEPVILNEATSTYTPPPTLTGQLGVNFMESIIRARTYGPFAKSQDQVINDTVDVLSQKTAHELYGTKDITIIDKWTEADIRNYGNAMAEAMTRNNVKDLEGELKILDDILNRGNTQRMGELKILAGVYERTRDDSLNVPVPALFVKQHLDLINTYHAIHKDIDAMTLSIDDPAFALLRLKRYEEDALGLKLALQNMYQGLEPYAGLFTDTDPAVLFVIFSPNNQMQ